MLWQLTVLVALQAKEAFVKSPNKPVYQNLFLQSDAFRKASMGLESVGDWEYENEAVGAAGVGQPDPVAVPS
jgi:hypothetical protein